MDAEKTTFDCWAVLELFGHVRLAGRVTEASIGGCSFLRVDVPEREGDGVQFTRYFGNGAIYSMTPVTEDVARRVGDGNAAAPVKPWEMPRPALPPPESRDGYRDPEEYAGPDPDDDDDDDEHF
jgi:hypothetical protein